MFGLEKVDLQRRAVSEESWTLNVPLYYLESALYAAQRRLSWLWLFAGRFLSSAKGEVIGN